MATLSPLSTMLQTSNVIWQSVRLTDELKLNLEYDVQRSVLNIFVKNASDDKNLFCQLNVAPATEDDDNEPKVCYEVTTTYVYDLIDENERGEQTDCVETRIDWSSSASSCFDDQTTDNDDGYSTHSLDDVEQQHHRPTPCSPLSIVPFSPCASRHASLCYSEQYVAPVRRLIEQLTWRNPFRKTMHDMMMMNHLFD